MPPGDRLPRVLSIGVLYNAAREDIMAYKKGRKHRSPAKKLWDFFDIRPKPTNRGGDIRYGMSAVPSWKKR